MVFFFYMFASAPETLLTSAALWSRAVSRRRDVASRFYETKLSLRSYESYK